MAKLLLRICKGEAGEGNCISTQTEQGKNRQATPGQERREEGEWDSDGRLGALAGGKAGKNFKKGGMNQRGGQVLLV